MSQFDTMMADMGAPLLMEHTGRSVTFQPPGADPVTLTASIGNTELLPRDIDDTAVYVQNRTAIIRTDPTAPEGGIANPVIGTTVLIDGTTWYVDEVELKSGSLARLSLVLREAHEVKGRQYRRQ